LRETKLQTVGHAEVRALSPGEREVRFYEKGK
jgi:hypothetical protein